MILLSHDLGSADKAKDKILESEQSRNGKGPVSRRKLDEIHANFAPARALDRTVLAALLSPAHRKLFAKTLR